MPAPRFIPHQPSFKLQPSTMFRPLLLIPVCGVLSLLAGCLYDHAPSGPARSNDTWLAGEWSAVDKAGHRFSAVMAPSSSDHYRVTLARGGGRTMEFDGWISRVDNFYFLVLKSLDEGPSQGKHALFHYELLAPGAPQPGGIGATRIRLSELQLDDSCLPLDAYKLRAAIRQGLRDQTLLPPRDAVADRKKNLENIPGSVIWTKTGGVTLGGETF
jgi:hypothetical protein